MTDNLYFFFNRIHKASIVSHHIHLTSISLITFFVKKIGYLWPPYGTGQEILFLPCGFFIFFLFPRLYSAITDWRSTILPHMVWPQCEFKMQV